MSSRPTPARPPEGAANLPVHERILRAGKALFATRGYEKTSTVSIARMAGTSESQLMKHFGSKEGLLEAVFTQGWEQFASMFPSIAVISSPWEKLRALLELFLGGLEKDPALKELLLLEGRRVRKEGNLVLLTPGYYQFVQLVDSILSDMQQRGELRDGIDVEAARSALMGMLEGMMRDQVLARRMDYPAGYNNDQVRRMFLIALDALRAPKK